MDQDPGTATLESAESPPLIFPPEKIKLINLRLRRGTSVSLTCNDDDNKLKIVFARKGNEEPIELDEEMDWDSIPSTLIPSAVIAQLMRNSSSEELSRYLMANILFAASTVTLKLIFADDGEETNEVEITFAAGNFKASAKIDLSEIINYVGETGNPPEPKRSAP